MTATKTGAQALVSTAARAGIDICFANPGTTEMPLVHALDTEPGIRPVLCLHENVATGAADTYARMTGKPAMTILHLGPGLANGLTNLHNARRAHSPVVNVVGDHASWHLAADPPLTSPVEQIAGAVSGHVCKSAGADHLAIDMAQAIAASRDNGGQVATLIAPHDAQGTDTTALTGEVAAHPAPTFSADQVRAAAEALQTERPALYLGGDALSEPALRLAGQLSVAMGAELICETFFARMEKGGDLPAPVKLPYFPEEAADYLRPFTRVVTVGAMPPVGFFGYPGGESHLTRPDQDCPLARVDEDVVGALAALCAALQVATDRPLKERALPSMPTGPLTAESISDVMVNLQPRDAIVMDEGLTASAAYHAASNNARRFTQLQLTGGAIGMGPSGATGAALACPDRQVINLQADGSGAYSLQALWTQAREKLNVITIIASNRSYHILNVEMLRAGIAEPGPAAQALASLDDPAIDWVSLAKGFGVAGEAVDTAEGLADALTRALETGGPYLIEAIMP